MFSLNAGNTAVVLKNIEPGQLQKVLDWYNTTEEYKFATGMDSPIQLELLVNQYIEIAGSARDFFLGIYRPDENTLMGILKGKLSDHILWITLIAISLEYQGNNLGSEAVTLLLDYVKNNGYADNAYLAVVDENLQGRNFWLKNGFRDFKRIEDRTLFNDRKYNVMIMQKRL